MKSVNLISESKFFKPEHFQVMDFYGRETVVFVYTEQEFVDKSTYFGLYDSNLVPLPVSGGKDNDVKYSAYRHYYCPKDFCIVIDKGTVGFDSVTFVSKCHIEETETEFIVSVMLETDESAVKKGLKAFAHNDFDVNHFLHEHFFSMINSYHASVPEVVRQIEETPFLDEFDKPSKKSIPVVLEPNGEYRLKFMSEDCYYKMNNGDKLAKGTFLYHFPMKNAVEIVEVKGFAHSMYAEFYAIVDTVYVYPRDGGKIIDDFPDFYAEHCISHHERELRKFIGVPEDLSYIPTNGKIGDKVIYQKIKTRNSEFGVSSKVFQFSMGRTGGFGDYQKTCGAFIRVERGATLGTLIEVEGRFKIMFYRCADVVKYRGEHYIKFIYDDESAFFDDFSDSGKSGFKKYHHREACRNVEYLLCREKITPVSIRKEQYDNFNQ